MVAKQLVYGYAIWRIFYNTIFLITLDGQGIDGRKKSLIGKFNLVCYCDR